MHLGNHQNLNPLERIALNSAQLMRTGLDRGIELSQSAMKQTMNATTIKSKQILPSEGATAFSMMKTGGKAFLILASIPTLLCIPLVALHAAHRLNKALEPEPELEDQPVENPHVESEKNKSEMELNILDSGDNAIIDSSKAQDAGVGEAENNDLSYVSRENNTSLSESNAVETSSESERIGARYANPEVSDFEEEGPRNGARYANPEVNDFEGAIRHNGPNGDNYDVPETSEDSYGVPSDGSEDNYDIPHNGSEDNHNVNEPKGEPVVNKMNVIDSGKIIKNIVKKDENGIANLARFEKTGMLKEEEGHLLLKATKLKLQTLGAGNFKTTYEAMFEVADKTHVVAISTLNINGDKKGIDKKTGRNLDKIDLMNRTHEVKMTKLVNSLKLENVVSGGILENKDTGDVFFVSKLCEGTLKSGWSDANPEQKRNLLIGLANGLRALHQAGIVHRDLKSDNILMKNNTAYITDFGAAAEINTRTPPININLYRASPHRLELGNKLADQRKGIHNELAQGNEDDHQLLERLNEVEQQYANVTTDAAEDRFALGLLLLHLVAGNEAHPWVDANSLRENPQELINKFIEDTFKPYVDQNNENPLKSIIQKLTVYNPAERMGDDEALEAIRGLSVEDIAKFWPNQNI